MNYKDKKLLVLGGAFQHCKLVKEAKELGIYTIVSDYLLPEDSPAIGEIAMNFSANAFGRSNAATPMGLKAMEELQKHNKDKSSASNAMCMLLSMNTAGFQLIPATVLAVLIGIGYKNPTEIIAPTLLVTFVAFISAIILAKVFEKLWKPQSETNEEGENVS